VTYLVSAQNLYPFGIDYPPDNIENFYEELEDPTDAGRVLAKLTPSEAGWLARHVADQIEKERAFAADAIESELKVIPFSCCVVGM
jgi:breast cancer 2 susceptibility protein